MMTATNVFVIETPLQLLNAIEAQEVLRLADCHLVILLSEDLPNRVFELLAQKEDWSSIQTFVIRSRRRPWNSRLLAFRLALIVREYYLSFLQSLQRRRYEKLIRAFGKVEVLALGNYLAHYMRHFANTAAPSALYLLDDGTDTLRINEARKRGPETRVASSVSKFRVFRNKIRNRYIDWNDNEAESITFFTSYDIEVKNGDGLIKNEYRRLRSLTRSVVPANEVFFLGQPLVEDGYIQRGTYTNLLSKIQGCLGPKGFVYIPHRRESSENVESLRKDLELSIRRFEWPIEYQIFAKGDVPHVVASFFCSALDNCRLMCDSSLQIKSFYLSPECLLCCHDFVQSIYDYFAANMSPHFQVIKLL
jgi:hypothetical protein